MNGRLANRMADDPVNDKISRQLADLYSKKKIQLKRSRYTVSYNRNTNQVELNHWLDSRPKSVSTRKLNQLNWRFNKRF